MKSSNRIKVSVSPNEILFPGSSITIESRDRLDPKSAQGAISLLGMHGLVQLGKDGRAAKWVPEGELPPGHHTLIITDLLTHKQQSICKEIQIPFFITDSKARIPVNVRVESMTRVQIRYLHTERAPSDRRPTGEFIELMKGSDRKTGAPVPMAFNEAGQAVEPERVFRQLMERRAKKFGKFHETLHARLQQMGPRDRAPVAIWLRSEVALIHGKKSSRGATAKPPRDILEQRETIHRETCDFAHLVEHEYGGNNCRADEFAPVVYAELTQTQIQNLAKQDMVLGVFLHETEGIEDLSNSIGIANSDNVHTLGFRGSGIKVAVWEDSPDVTTDLSIAARYKTSGFATSNHARHTHGIIKNIERNAPHGHAPSCSLHSANTKDLDALRWAAQDKGCTVISQSFHRSSEPGSASMSFDDIYKDWLALQWPYPTICQAAGNYWLGDPDGIMPPSNEYVNHKGYNSLAVGNHDDTAGAMSGDSVFRNPSSTHGDRELPEIAANGTSVTTVGLTMSGTSMASPAAAGCAALIQNVNATLKSWPEGCRAILLAGAKKNVSGRTWWKDVVGNVDASDGSGAVDALESAAISKQRRWRNAPATIKGWDVGTLSSREIGRNKQTSFSYFVQLPTWIFAPRHVKVALAWDSEIQTFNFPFVGEILLGSKLGVDLDLQVFDSHGTQVGYSGSWDNSYEIAEFDGRPGETYTIKIRRWSGTNDVWYGIAWTVTGGVFWADTTRFTALQNRLNGSLSRR